MRRKCTGVSLGLLLLSSSGGHNTIIGQVPFLFYFTEEKRQIRQAILDCSLTGGNSVALPEELGSEEDEE